MANSTFKCLLTERQSTEPELQLVELPCDRLPAGDVEIEVHWSSINYKDALAATGHPGVVKTFPHVPGIDAAGVVCNSNNDNFQVGDQVVVTGYDLGQGTWGGWSERIRVPADWIVRLPSGLNLRDAMILGTAGFTAAQCVLAIQRNGVQPQSGEIVVTGATGGVGCIAVHLLAKLGYDVVAVTGKADQVETLKAWGAKRILSRSELIDTSNRPLLRSQWAGGVDTVGGNMLTTLLRSTKYGGCVAACGLVAGPELAMTLYPFLLRGISLCGVASADCPKEQRLRIWDLLGGDWQIQSLESVATEISLSHVQPSVEKILRGEMIGRTIISCSVHRIESAAPQ